MRVGLRADFTQAGVFLATETQKLLGIQQGDYVEITCLEQGTRICRMCHPVTTTCPVRSDYAYLDPNSIRYLCAALHDTVEVQVAALPLDVP